MGRYKNNYYDMNEDCLGIALTYAGHITGAIATAYNLCVGVSTPGVILGGLVAGGVAGTIQACSVGDMRYGNQRVGGGIVSAVACIPLALALNTAVIQPSIKAGEISNKEIEMEIEQTIPQHILDVSDKYTQKLQYLQDSLNIEVQNNTAMVADMDKEIKRLKEEGFGPVAEQKRSRLEYEKSETVHTINGDTKESARYGDVAETYGLLKSYQLTKEALANASQMTADGTASMKDSAFAQNVFNNQVNAEKLRKQLRLKAQSNDGKLNLDYNVNTRDESKPLSKPCTSKEIVEYVDPTTVDSSATAFFKDYAKKCLKLSNTQAKEGFTVEINERGGGM